MEEARPLDCDVVGIVLTKDEIASAVQYVQDRFQGSYLPDVEAKLFIIQLLELIFEGQEVVVLHSRRLQERWAVGPMD